MNVFPSVDIYMRNYVLFPFGDLVNAGHAGVFIAGNPF